jgi:hypothetical protein
MLVEREARGLVRFLFANLLPRTEVLAAIREDATINQSVRQEALKLAETFPVNTNAIALNNASWAAVREPGADTADYQWALREAPRTIPAYSTRSGSRTTAWASTRRPSRR